MRERGQPSFASRLSVRGLLQRFGVGALLLVSAGVLFLSSADSRHVAALQAALLDITVAVARTVDQPVQSVREIIEDGARMLDVHSDNQRLRQENERLRGWEAEARRAFAENETLRGILELSAPDLASFASARIVGAAMSSPLRTVIIDRGSYEGIAVGDAVVSPDGLVGHVVETSGHAARVLLLTDASSQVAVFGERSGKTAILAGDRSPLLGFSYLDEETVRRSFSEGELLYTSGQGGLLPANLMVGTVVRDGARLRVLPGVDWSELRFVQAIRRQGFAATGSAAGDGDSLP